MLLRDPPPSKYTLFCTLGFRLFHGDDTVCWWFSLIYISIELIKDSQEKADFLIKPKSLATKTTLNPTTNTAYRYALTFDRSTNLNHVYSYTFRGNPIPVSKPNRVNCLLRCCSFA